ncbi:MAG TPA: Gfo/Idh/MocA family oxidoreductase [Chloroflexota bacterium]
MPTSSPLEAVLIGAGNRGTFTYGTAALEHPETLRFVAVAEPDAARRDRFARQHGIPAGRCFASWQELLAAGRLAPALVCATLDRQHVAPAVAALETGYHVLLEKPMAVTAEECVRIVQAQERTGLILMISHVMRYAPFYEAMHQIITSGRLGDIVTAEQRENVAFWHMAHSYVRGNWGNAERSSPMILAKCCHDLDLLVWMLAGDPAARLHSFGSLLHFRPEHAPPGAPARCTDGCPDAEECPFYAPRLYLTDDLGWPTETISVDLSYEARLHALETGPYGRCVYHTDNNVVDHQVVNMELRSGAIATLVMHGHSDREERTMRYDGTRATLRGRFSYSGQPELTVHDHRSGALERVAVSGSSRHGHGGGDSGLVTAFARAVHSGSPDDGGSARGSLESHLLAFAAERSRLGGKVIDMAAFREEIEIAAVTTPECA